MQAAKEKISNLASVAKEHLVICKAKADEKAEMATVRTHEEKRIAKERRKAKEAQAKMEMHQAKANHAAHKLTSKHRHYNQHPVVPGGVGTAAPMVGTTAPTYPVGGQAGTYPSSHPVGVGTAVPMAGTTAPTYPLGGHATGRTYL